MLDETVDVYLVLRTLHIGDAALRSYLGRLTISLSAHIANSHAPDSDNPPAAEVIYNGTVEKPQSPLAVVDDPADSDDEEGQARQVYVVWKLPVFLGRPRIRLQNPGVLFAAVATLRPPEDPSAGRKNGYLPSRTPLGLNLLESFGADRALGGVRPRLSAQRVSRVAPVTRAKEQQVPLKGLKSIALKVYPAVHSRVRFARPNSVPTSPDVIALIEVDFTPFFDCEVLLSKIHLSLPSGVITDLNHAHGLSLPLSCVAHDHVTFMYRLAPREQDDEADHPTQDLDIAIDITALVQPGVCTPKLAMSWTMALDFTLPVNPGFGTALPNPSLQRNHRPSLLSIDGSSLVTPAVSRPDSLPSLEAAAARSAETTIPDFGITMTFTAPTEPIYPGDEFSWTVFVVNRTSAASTTLPPGPPPRKLALLAIPRRRRNDLRIIRPPSTAAGHRTGAGAGAGVERIADAVLDDNIVHAMQRSSLVDCTDVVCLSPDTRVGPLALNACHVVELRFLALREGIVGVEAIRVIDLATQEHVDVRELPIMVVQKRP